LQQQHQQLQQQHQQLQQQHQQLQLQRNRLQDTMPQELAADGACCIALAQLAHNIRLTLHTRLAAVSPLTFRSPVHARCVAKAEDNFQLVDSEGMVQGRIAALEQVFKCDMRLNPHSALKCYRPSVRRRLKMKIGY
jgi:hypothetical protein